MGRFAFGSAARGRFIPAFVAGLAALFHAAAGAGGSYYGPDLKTAVQPVPDSVTLASTNLVTYASFQVTLTHKDKYDVLRPIYFNASTAVTGSTETSAFVVASLPAGCTATAANAIECVFTDGLSAAGSTKTFTLTVTVPTTGSAIAFTSKTLWKDGYELEYTPPFTVSTALTAPDPNLVSSYLPAGGGSLYTGAAAGVATPTDPWTTTVQIPTTAASTTVRVSELVDPVTCAANLLNCSSSTLTIPGTFDALIITLRRDASTIAKKAKISSARIYYDGLKTPPAGVTYPLEVPACTDTTYGTLPKPGIPCIESRTEYPDKSTKKCPVPPGFEGDWEFRIRAIDNGRYIN